MGWLFIICAIIVVYYVFKTKKSQNSNYAQQEEIKIDIFADMLERKNSSEYQEDANNLTNLMKAVLNKNESEVKNILVHNKAEVNARTKNKLFTPLFFAVQTGNLNIIKLLIENGADVNCRARKEYYDTVLLQAISNNDLNVVKLLVENGANINANRTPTKNEDALFTAEILGHIEIIKVLNSYNMDKSSTTAELFIFIMGEDLEGLANYINTNNVDINRQDTYGHTLVMHAALVGSVPIVKYLLENGARIDLVDSYGHDIYTTLERTFEKGTKEEILKLIHTYEK